jgi:hypothetical protein
MIFTAPDHVLKFIGFGLMNLGEESGTGRISGAFNRVSEMGAQMGTGMGRRRLMDGRASAGGAGNTGRNPGFEKPKG